MSGVSVRLNVFEGARRIALVAGVVATVGTLIGLIIHEPYSSLSYTVAHPNGPFIRSDEQCPSEGGTHYFTAMTTKGQSVSVNLCMLPKPFGDKGELLIPFKVDENGMVWGTRTYSREMSAYERRIEGQFKLPRSDEQEIIKKISHEYRENFMSGLGYLAIGLAVFAGLVWITGWIMRGFLGIPRGQDSRLAETPSTRGDV
jgi:hypothetical protein